MAETIETLENARGELDSYKWWASFAIIMGMLSINLNVSASNLALPKIMSGFGANMDKAQWVINAYMITYTVATPIVGWLGGWTGNKNLFLSAMGLFLFSMLLSGLAWNMDSLIAFRILSGLAAGIATPIGIVILYEAFPPEQHGLAMGISMFSMFSASMIAFPLGGYLVEELSWRYIFHISIPMGIMGMVVGKLILRESGKKGKRSIDILGLSMLALFVVSLLLALSEGRREGWDSDYILTLFGLSAAGGAAFVLVELRVKEPLVDLRLFRKFNFTLLNLVSFINEMDVYGTFFLLQFYLQTFRSYSPLQAGLIMLPSVIATSTSSLLFGRLGDYIDTKYIITFGMAFRSFAIWRFTYLNQYTSIPIFLSIVILRSLSNGLLLPNFAKGIMRSLPGDKLREGSGLMTLIRGIGSVTGIATLTAILTQRTDYHTVLLAERTNTSVFGIKEALSSLSGMFQQAGDLQGLAQTKGLSLIFGRLIKEAMMFAYHDTFFFMSSLLALAVIPAIFLKHTPPGQRAQ